MSSRTWKIIGLLWCAAAFVVLTIGFFELYGGRWHAARFPNTLFAVLFTVLPAALGVLIIRSLRKTRNTNADRSTKKQPAPPIEQLAAHPRIKTKREQLDEETGEHYMQTDEEASDVE